MKERQDKNIFLMVWISAILIIMAALIVLVNLLSENIYIDTTTAKIYSFDEKTEMFLKQNKVPIVVKFYISKDLSKKNPVLGNYADYVRRLLDAYENKSDGLVTVSVVETEPFSSTLVAAKKSGIEEFDFNDGNQYMVLGASFTNAQGRTLVIPKFIPERLNYVEDDISRILSVLTEKNEPVLAVLSPYFSISEEKNPLAYSYNHPFIKQLDTQGYEILSLGRETSNIPKNVDVLLVYYPVDLSRISVYAIDQYLMRGGKVIVMTDLFSEERFKERDEFILYNSGMEDFLANSGIKYSETVLVGDSSNSRESVMNGKKIKYPFWLIVKNNNQVLFLNHAGVVVYTPQDNLKEKVLLSTGKVSGLMNIEHITDINYDKLIRRYMVSDVQYPLAVLLEGKFSSLYENPLLSRGEDMFLPIAVEDGKLAVIGDADMMNSFLWDEKSDIKHEFYETIPISDNVYFLRDLIDDMIENSYVKSVKKSVIGGGETISQIIYQKAVAKYQHRKNVVENELSEVKNKISEYEDKKILLKSIKQVKEFEELKRKEAALDLELSKIKYLTKELYDSLLLSFTVIILLIIPSIVVLIVMGIYKLFKYKELKNGRIYKCIKDTSKWL